MTKYKIDGNGWCGLIVLAGCAAPLTAVLVVAVIR
jgi:hypothetical protein